MALFFSTNYDWVSKSTINYCEPFSYSSKLCNEITTLNGVVDLKEDEVIIEKSYLHKLYIESLKQQIDIDNFEYYFDKTFSDEVLYNFIAEGLTIKIDFMETKNEDNNKVLDKKSFKVVGFFGNSKSIRRDTSDRPFLFISDELYIKQLKNQYIISKAFVQLLGDKKKDVALIKNIDLIQPYSIYYAQTEDVLYNVKQLEELKWAGLFFSVICGIVTIILLFNYMSGTIISTKKSIGILKAMGTNKKNIYLIYLFEPLLISFIASILSLFTTYGLVEYFNNMFKNSYELLVFKPWLLLGIFAAGSIVICLLGCLIPILKITKKKAVEIISG